MSFFVVCFCFFFSLPYLQKKSKVKKANAYGGWITGCVIRNAISYPSYPENWPVKSSIIFPHKNVYSKAF